MKDIWTRHKIKIILLCYILLLTAFVRWVVFPTVKKIESKSDSVQEKIIDSQISQLRLAKIPEMENDYNIFQSNKEALDVILEENREVDFIKSLEVMAKDTGNDISLKISDNAGSQKTQSKSSNDKNADKSIQEKLVYPDYISMQIELKGGYSNLLDFMKKLENNNYYVNVISLESKKETQSDGSENNTQVLPSSLFSSGNVKPNQPNQPEAKVENEKDILDSILNVVIYIKK